MPSTPAFSYLQSETWFSCARVLSIGICSQWGGTELSDICGSSRPKANGRQVSWVGIYCRSTLRHSFWWIGDCTAWSTIAAKYTPKPLLVFCGIRTYATLERVIQGTSRVEKMQVPLHVLLSQRSSHTGQLKQDLPAKRKKRTAQHMFAGAIIVCT